MLRRPPRSHPPATLFPCTTLFRSLASIVQERLSALARAHALTMPKDSAAGSNDSVRLHVLLRTILAPYEGAGGGDDRLRINGDDVTLPGNAMTTIALILHELATNAAKYGALDRKSTRLNSSH